MSNFVDQSRFENIQKHEYLYARMAFDSLHESVTGKHLSEYGASLMSRYITEAVFSHYGV